MLMLGANTTLTGAGVINDAGQINASASASRIVNLNDTIVANAETSNGIDSLFAASPAGTTFVNGAKGTVESEGLLFVGGQQMLSIVNSGSFLCNVGYLDVTNTNMTGAGFVSIAGFASAQFTGGGVISGQTFSVAAGGHLYLEGPEVELSGVFTNAGTVAVAGSPGLFLTGNTTLIGGGTIRLGNGGGGNIAGHRGATLTNADNTITGFGTIGNGQIGIVNQAGGTIYGSGLTIDGGRHTLANAGLIDADFGPSVLEGPVDNSGTIEAVGGQLTLNSPITNDGLLSVSGARGASGLLTVESAVTGTGSTVIGNGGTLDADGLFSEYHNGAFEQSVTFTGAGFLHLAASREYEGTISGFSATGETSLDLGDIAFVSSSQASFSGAASGGVLTVTAGKHSAAIHLSGDYLSSTFVTVNDGHAGVIVVAIATPGGTPPHEPTHALVAAMASLGGSGAVPAHPIHAWTAREPLLSSPRTVIA